MIISVVEENDDSTGYGLPIAHVCDGIGNILRGDVGADEGSGVGMASWYDVGLGINVRDDVRFGVVVPRVSVGGAVDDTIWRHNGLCEGSRGGLSGGVVDIDVDIVGERYTVGSVVGVCGW